jgi:hypothetical protein
MKDKRMIRLSLDLTPEIKKELRLLAIKANTTMTEVITKLILNASK